MIPSKKFQDEIITKVKKIKDVAAFLRDAGLIFEINRKILHPLGMALEITINDDGSEDFGDLWDCRNDPEGIIYAKDCFESGIKKFNTYMEEHGNKALKSRMKKLGYIMQEKRDR